MQASGVLDRLSIDLLARALDQTGSLVSGIDPDQASLPTPCTDFDLRTLVNHTVYDLQSFRTMLAGGERQPPGRDLIGDAWSSAYNAAADELLATWRERGTEGTLKLQIGELPVKWALGQHLADIAVHGWDIGRATGQDTDLDPEVGQVALEWAQQYLKPQFRGQAFAPEVAVPPDMPLYDRLAAHFGRDPHSH